MTQGNGGACLVAVLYVLETKTVYASTIPRGGRASFMTREINKQRSNFVFAQYEKGIVTYHAEDAAYFNYESSMGAKFIDDKTHYPAGSIMAVWGLFRNDPTDPANPKAIKQDQENGNDWSPCPGPRNPSCETVARKLRVAYKGWNPEPLTPEQRSSSEYSEIDFVDVVMPEDKSKRSEIRGAGPILRARDDTKDCIKLPTKINPATLTIGLPEKDYTTPPITAGPAKTSTPSCSVQNQDPDQGINSAHCVCDGVTLPLLTPTHITKAAQSCEYQSMPTGGHITTKAHLGPATTDTKMCQVCTPVVNNEDECTSMKSCVVQTGAVTVQAGSSSVHVGTVTGSVL